MSVSRESSRVGGLRRMGSDGSSIPSFRTSIQATNHRFLLTIFQEIDNYVSFDWREVAKIR